MRYSRAVIIINNTALWRQTVLTGMKACRWSGAGSSNEFEVLGITKKYSITRAYYKCLAINIYLFIIVLDINAHVSVPRCMEAKINMANAAKGVGVFWL